MVAWLLPLFRQRGCRYFLYFFFLAISDPIITIIRLFHPLDATLYYLVISTLLLISLIKKRELLLLLVVVFFLSLYLNNPELRFFNLLVHFAILLYFLKELLVIISKESKIVIFNLILVLYEVTLLFKIAASYLNTGYLFYYLTTAFEIFIAIFFMFYNEKNSPVFNLEMEPNDIN